MIRQISNKVDIAAAPNLIWETFLQFEAPDYSNDESPKSEQMKVLSHLYRSLFSICGSGLSQTRLY